MLSALFRARSVIPITRVGILFASLLCGLFTASSAANASGIEHLQGRGSPDQATQPFELRGILQFGEDSQASIYPKSGEGQAVWLAPGQSRGNLSLIEINAQKSQVKIRYAGEVHVLRLQRASDLPIPLQLNSDVIEEEGRLVRKMRAPAGRGRSKPSGTLSVAIPKEATRTVSRDTGLSSNAPGADMADAGGSPSSTSDEGAKQGDGSAARTEEERKFPARRASIKIALKNNQFE